MKKKSKEINNIEETTNQEIWWVLKEIKKAHLLTPKNRYVEFNINQSAGNENIPSPDIQRRIIYKFESLGGIEICKKFYVSKLVDSPFLEDIGLKPTGFILKILQPKFEEIYEKYRTQFDIVLSDSDKKVGEEKTIEMNKIAKPYTLVENGKGYFKFYKQGEKIKIGGENTRHFRLLQCLCEPLGVPKTIEAVFEAIKLPKDSRDSDLENYSPMAKNKKITRIKFAIKELQKIKKLQGKLKFHFGNQNQNVWLEIK